jgi:hypothetical protein
MSAIPAAGHEVTGVRPIVPRAAGASRVAAAPPGNNSPVPLLVATLADPALASLLAERPNKASVAPLAPRRTTAPAPNPEGTATGSAPPDPTALLGAKLLESLDGIASMLRQLLAHQEPIAVAVPLDPAPAPEQATTPVAPRVEPLYEAPPRGKVGEQSAPWTDDVDQQSVVPAWCAAIQKQTTGLSFPFITTTRCGRVASYIATLLHLCRRLAKETGQNVLLLDAALPNHELTTACGLDDEPGLYEVLTRRLPLAACVQPLLGTSVGIVPAGQSNPIDTSAPLDLATGLAELSGRFGYVVCDTGSMVHPWSLALARAADAAYLVLELGTTPQQLALDCVDRFRQQGGNFCHGILLPPPPSKLA